MVQPVFEVYSFLFGMVLGFSLTIPPGPMNALIASESVKSVRKGIVAGTGAMSADLALAAIVFVLRSVVELGSFVRYIYVLGAAVICFLGVMILRNRKKSSPPLPDKRTYAKALALGISNPFQIFWWLTAGLAFAYLSGAVFFVGLFAAVAVWIVVLPYVLHAGTRAHAGFSEGVTIVSALLMFLFAAYFVLAAAGLV